MYGSPRDRVIRGCLRRPLGSMDGCSLHGAEFGALPKGIGEI